MKKINIQNVNIDDVKDGVDFKMILYNTEKYDPQNLRTITTNTVLELEIINNKDTEINIDSIGLGIVENDNVHKIFCPKTSIPKRILAKNESVSFSFYAYEIRLIFGRYKKEKGRFILNTPYSGQYYYSSSIDGDKLERMVAEMEDEEMGFNWGAANILRLNKEYKYDFGLENFAIDKSRYYSELDVDLAGDGVKISLAFFNDRILDKENSEIKSKTILKLEIRNLNDLSIDIKNPILLIKTFDTKKGNVKGYVSSELKVKFPVEISKEENFEVLYDTDSIDDLLNDSIGEKVIFLVEDVYGTKYYTEKISGDNLEKLIDEHNLNTSSVSTKKIYAFDEVVY